MKQCQGHGHLEESSSDKPQNVNIAFGDIYNANSSSGFTLGGSESSTTSNSRLTAGQSGDMPSYIRHNLSSTSASTQSPDILAYLRQTQSSASSDIPTYSEYGQRRRRRHITSGQSL